MWSPTHPALFACVDGVGHVDLWNLNNDTEVLLILQLSAIANLFSNLDFDFSNHMKSCAFTWCGSQCSARSHSADCSCFRSPPPASQWRVTRPWTGSDGLLLVEKLQWETLMDRSLSMMLGRWASMSQPFNFWLYFKKKMFWCCRYDSASHLLWRVI